MLKTSLSLFLLLIFLALSFLHFYWALGGEWGFSSALPTDESGRRLVNPTPLASTVVGMGLLAFGTFYLLKSGLVNNFLPSIASNIVSWVIPLIFMLRAIGDFKYIGFFKQISQTQFGQADSFYFSPLCLIVSVIGFILIRMK